MFSNAKDIFCKCIEVARTYGAQRIDIYIILTALSSSWTAIDFFARGVNHEASKTHGAIVICPCTLLLLFVFSMTCNFCVLHPMEFITKFDANWPSLIQLILQKLNWITLNQGQVTNGDVSFRRWVTKGKADMKSYPNEKQLELSLI